MALEKVEAKGVSPSGLGPGEAFLCREHLSSRLWKLGSVDKVRREFQVEGTVSAKAQSWKPQGAVKGGNYQ